MAGINMVHVPYRGAAPALADLIGGQVEVLFDSLPASIESIKAGRVRPLAVTTARRSRLLPDVPTISEFLPGYEASAWQGIGAPKATPVQIIDQLNREINAGLADPRILARFADLGITELGGSSAEFRQFVADETNKWGQTIHTANIRQQ